MRSRVSVSAAAQRSRAARPSACDLVGALRRPRDGLVPLAGDVALLLERAQDAVEVADVHALVAGHLGQPLEQVVPVGRALPQEQEERGDLKALDAAAAAATAVSASAVSVHMSTTYSSCG